MEDLESPPEGVSPENDRHPEAPASDAPGQDAAALVTPGPETPGGETPAPEAAAEESVPSAELPAAGEAPASDAPGQDAAALETPGPETPGGETAAEESAASEELAPAFEAPASDAPRQDAAALVTLGPETPGGETPAPEAAAEESVPSEELPPAFEARETPGPETPAPELAAEEQVASEELPPAGEAPADRVSMDELLPAPEISPEFPVEDGQLRAVLEAIVYVAEEPLTLAQIAAALQQPAERIRSLLEQLITDFDQPQHGITIREVAGGYKMATKPEHHDAVRAFVKSLKPPLKLSLPALETLAVIAYKQPVTAPEIMEVRGVQGAGVLKTLLDRKLIAVAGRKNVVGKPILYKTTKEFLIQFGLKDLSELPSLKEFEEIRRMAFSDSEPPPAPAGPELEAIPESDTPPDPEST